MNKILFFPKLSLINDDEGMTTFKLKVSENGYKL